MGGQHRKQIRSFVKRQGRITRRQQWAIDHFWNDYVYALNETHSGNILFNHGVIDNERPVSLEIGFGMGAALLHQALAYPDWQFYGIEVYEPGIGAVIADLKEKDVNNVKLLYGDAMEFIRDCFHDNSLNCLQIFFPDPWPKRKHHKRRLIQIETIALFISKLKPGARLQIATDWAPYSEHILRCLQRFPELVNLGEDSGFSKRLDHRPLTKFERRGERKGHAVFDFHYRLDFHIKN